MKEFKVPMKFHTSSYRQVAAVKRKVDAKIKRIQMDKKSRAMRAKVDHIAKQEGFFD